MSKSALAMGLHIYEPQQKLGIKNPSALSEAILAKDVEKVRSLLQENHDPNQKLGPRLVPLALALNLGQREITKLLLEHGAKPAQKDHFNFLVSAIELGYLDIVTLMIEKNFSTAGKNKRGWNLLHSAANSRFENILAYFIKLHPEWINAPTEDNPVTPLVIASTQGYVKNVQLLLDAQADPNFNLDNFDRLRPPPLAAAAINKEKRLGSQHKEVMRLLLARNANPNIIKVRSILGQLIGANDLERSTILLDHGAKPDLHGDDLITPLHEACMKGNLRTAELLIARNADVNFASKIGRTPLSYACASKNGLEIVKYLLQHNANLDLKDSEGNTMLHQAVYDGNPALIKYLLERRSTWDFFQANNKGKTVFDLAKKSPASLILITPYLRPDQDILLKTTFFTTLPGAFLGEKIPIRTKVYFEQNNHLIKMVFNYYKNQKSTNKTIVITLKDEDNLTIKIIPTVGKEKIASFSGNLLKIEKKDKKKGKIYVTNPAIPLFKSFAVKKEKIGLVISGSATINAREYPFVLKPLNDDISEDYFYENPLEPPKAVNMVALVQPIAPQAPQKYWDREAVIGTYRGTLDGEEYSVAIAEPHQDGFRIEFLIAKRDGSSRQTHLWVKAPQSLLHGYQRFYPQTFTDKGQQFFPNLTTFEGGKYTAPSSKKGHRGQRAKQLCFNSALVIEELLPEQKIILKAETSKGELKLEKISHRCCEFAPEAPVEQEFYEEWPGAFELISDDETNDPIALEPEQPLIVPQEINAPAPRSKKTKKPEQAYFEPDFLISKKEQEENERRRQGQFQIVRDACMKKEDPIPSPEKKKSPVKNRNHRYEGYVGYDGQRPPSLNPHTTLTDNPLYYPNEDLASNLWFGQAIISQYGEDFHADPSDRIVIGFKNLNDYPAFAPGASWCSFYSKSYKENNFAYGINAHCSIHENNQKIFINISHHGLFMVENATHNNEFLLHKINNDGSMKKVIYKMRQKAAANFGREELSDMACKYIGFTVDPSIKDKENKNFSRLLEMSHNLKQRLITPMPLPLGNDLFAQFGDDRCQLFANDQTWFYTYNWGIAMVNENTAFINILFAGHNGLESLTFKLKIAPDGSYKIGAQKRP